MESFLPLIILLCAVLSAIGWLHFKNIANPITLFCGVWTVILLLYSLHLFDIYYASNKVLLICIVGIISFFAGGYLRVFRRRMTVASVNISVKEQRVNYKVMSFFNILSLVVLLYFGIVSIRLLASGFNFAYIRDVYMSEEGSGIGSNKFTQYLMSFFIWPWNLTIIPLSVILFVHNKGETIKNRFFLFSSLANVVLFIIVTAGRISIVYYVMYFVIIMLLTKRKVRLSGKQKFLILFLVVMGYTTISFISNSRGSSSLNKNAYLYISGCIPFFTDRLEKFMVSSGQYTYGLASLHGFIMIFMVPLGKLFGYPELYSISIANSYVQDRIFVGPHSGFNAFTTLFYFFYIDGGFVAVILLSFIYGFFSVGSYLKLMRKQTIFRLLVYLLVTFGLLFSMVRFQYINFRYVGSFIYAWLCFNRVKIKKRVIGQDVA